MNSTNQPTSTSPRAFCVGVGTAFFTVGAVMVAVSVSYVLASVLYPVRISNPPATWLGYLQGERRYLGLVAIDMFSLLLGGMLFVAVGIGLRAERPGSATLALIITAILDLIFTGSCLLFFIDGRTGWAIAGGIIVVLNLFFFLAATGCMSTFRKFPPPKNQNVVTDAQIEELRDLRRQHH